MGIVAMLQRLCGRTRVGARPRRTLQSGAGEPGRLASAAVGLSFLAVAVPLALLVPSERTPSTLLAVLLVGAYAAVSRVEFTTGTRTAVPTQLILVPMLFCLPAPDVPLFVAAAYLLGNLPDIVGGDRRLQRAFGLVGDSWHAVGPALVFTVAGEPAAAWPAVPVLLGALAAQCAFDLAAAETRTWLARHGARVDLRLVAWVFLVDGCLAPIGFLAAVASHEVGYAFLLLLPLSAILSGFTRERRARLDHAVELSQAYRGTALLLGDVLEADDAYTGSHSRDVVTLVLEVSDRLGVPARERRSAELTALLHDVGKIRIPDELINKPGALSAEERAVIEQHTIEGERMLDQVGGMLGDVGRIVRSCHERWDGRGYPDGLAGEAIPLIARIVTCCDAFSAMTTTRAYRAALPVETAVAELRANSGTQFDPAVVEALVALAEPETEAAPAAVATARESLQAAY